MTPRGLALVSRWYAVVLCLVASPLRAEDYRVFEGHGGPVMGLAVARDGDSMLTASFDNSVGHWAFDGEEARWFDGHEAAVNRVIYLDETRAASGGDDYAVMIWDLTSGAALHRLEGHRGKVMGLAADPAGHFLASASWDGTVRIWNTQTGAETAEIDAHRGGANAVAFSGDGRHLYTAGTDGTVLEWAAEDWSMTRRLASHGFGVNVLVLNDDAGWIAYGALDGGTRVLDLASGEVLTDLTAGRRPILAMAASPDGARIAVGDGEGYIMVIETGTWRILRDFRAALHGPIWALDFSATGRAIIAGGIANEAMLWPIDGADSAPRMAEQAREFHVDPAQVSNGERQFLRKCSVCHTLGTDGERRAGPALAGLFGRKAGSLPEYPYSPAVRDADLIWTEETIDRLFEIGPEHYIPGTKMPMQQIAKPEDRADLIDFLKRETAMD